MPTVNRFRVCSVLLMTAAVVMARCADAPPPSDSGPDTARRWLAGDSHIHSHWSAGYDRQQNPPAFIKGREAIYSTPRNAAMARRFGLSWMVTTDHGGPNHAKFNMTEAYAELKASRQEVPDVLQFYGMELNMPGMDHHTLIIPHAEDESPVLFDIEHQFDKLEVWPVDPARDTETARGLALAHMTRLTQLPLLFANHPSRSATGIGQYGADEPWELRGNNDQAPDIYRGMEGGPGHQAATLAPDGRATREEPGRPVRARGLYRNPGAGTLGGFDQMTAIVGGLWDSLLGEGRRFWIVASSDSHVNFTETSRRGSDFWPGQFHKTYVYARPTYDDVLGGLRDGRIFAVAGDLVTALDVVASAESERADIGGTLQVGPRQPVDVTIRFRDPDDTNASGDRPTVRRVDLIQGEVRGPVGDPGIDTNDTTRVVARFTETDWTRSGDVLTIATSLPASDVSTYVRVRGTSTSDAEPVMDEPGEDPWADLWFYSNPIFIEVVD